MLGAVKHQRFSDQQLETFAARAPGICPKPVCDAGEPCPLPPLSLIHISLPGYRPQRLRMLQFACTPRRRAKAALFALSPELLDVYKRQRQRQTCRRCRRPR